MKKILCLLLLLGAVVAVGAPKKPAKKYVNRYSMPIKANPDGSFAVASPNAYKHFDLQDPEHQYRQQQFHQKSFS